jgi:hypothetical protein
VKWGGEIVGQIVTNAQNSTTEAGKNEWLTILNLVDPEVIKDQYIQMRTAVLALKTKDAIDELGLPKDVSSSVIMGDGYSPEANSFITDDVLAQKAIRNLFVSMDPIITHTLHQYSSISREVVMEKLNPISRKFLFTKSINPKYHLIGNQYFLKQLLMQQQMSLVFRVKEF